MKKTGKASLFFFDDKKNTWTIQVLYLESNLRLVPNL